MAYDELLAKRISSAFKTMRVKTEEKKMFGGICYMIQDKMCCGIVKEDLMLRVSHEQYELLLKKPNVRPMDFTGKPMKGFLYVNQKAFPSEKALCDWIAFAVDFVKTNPAKKKKTTKMKK
ncbi:MAG: hypothetical protein FD123_172 [Bacteroidetes bacterium]|nr:MAG: hypothetical protein FD123_172 [Bacteroidota bacterium]